MSKHKNDSKSHEENTASPVNPEGATPHPEAAAKGAANLDVSSESLVVETGADGVQAASEPSNPLVSELESARDEIAALRAEVSELNEKYLRKLADEVNFRKRMLREKEEAQKYAVASLLGDLIPVLDDFDRGIASAEGAKSHEQLIEGVTLIRKQLSQMLENKYALRRFESKGAPFDPNRHEALFAEPSDVEEPIVAEEYLPGYSLHDRILRTAKVRVKIPGPGKSATVQEDAAGQSAANDATPADKAGQA